ncbi:YfgM family protein [Marinomonas spartinae]|uniref:YfgM family protein n=1 Tax=Marinomonas spartinae TaxID=1792290 RepID=UPI0018F17ACD|nr:tetratricopeptide repeat protein [Marinomonas spartinae]MBJ7553487.1 tetratricopeptide repeat protein [Marinomonas spartinae]
MSELKTEEEQIEALKQWWKKYGTILLVAVVIVVGGYFGWQAWQRSQATHISEASALYQNLLQASGDLSDKDNQKTVAYISNQLEKDYSDTGYAMLGQLIAARLEVHNKDYDKAISDLEAAAKATDDASFKAIAYVRIARVLAQKADYAKALATLDKVTEPQFLAQREETAGDIYLLQGKRSEARAAYEKASKALGNKVQHPLLDIKLRDLVKG